MKVRRGFTTLFLLTALSFPAQAENIGNTSDYTNIESYKCDLMMRGYEFTNEGLSEAIIKQDKEAVELFIKADININLTDKEGFTALDRAIEIKDQNTVEILCHAGGEKKFSQAENIENQTKNETIQPQILVYNNGNISSVINKQKAESSYSETENSNAENSIVLNEFCKAVNEGRIEEVKKQISSTSDLDILTEEGLAPIHYAIFNNDPEMIDVLINGGAEINIRTSDGLTPLDITVLNNQQEIAKKLLEKGGAMSFQVAIELEKFGCLVKYDEIFDLYDASFSDIFTTMKKIQEKIDLSHE